MFPLKIDVLGLVLRQSQMLSNISCRDHHPPFSGEVPVGSDPNPGENGDIYSGLRLPLIKIGP